MNMNIKNTNVTLDMKTANILVWVRVKCFDEGK